MKTKTNNISRLENMYAKCKLCSNENFCTVYENYVTLKDENKEDAATLLCYVANLDHHAMKLYEYFKNKKPERFFRFTEILWECYGNAFGLLWRRYNENDKDNATEKERRDMHIYIYDVLDKYDIVANFEAKLGIDLTTQYNNYFADAAIEEYKNYAKQL